MAIEIRNAVIGSAEISVANHGAVIVWLNLKYEGDGQSFGGFANYVPDFPDRDTTGMFVWEILKTVGVQKWSELAGKPLRVKADWSKVYAIGNFIEDRWFEPAVALRTGVVATNVR